MLRRENRERAPEPVKQSIVLGHNGRMTGEKLIPKATAFRIDPEYADKVAVTIGPDGRLTYFPAPSDITPQSAPLDLGDGWWLNRQGISPASVFTTYTFSQYADLKQTPSASTLLKAVIPGSKVIRMVTLPYSVNEAESHITEIKNYLNGN